LPRPFFRSCQLGNTVYILNWEIVSPDHYLKKTRIFKYHSSNDARLEFKIDETHSRVRISVKWFDIIDTCMAGGLRCFMRSRKREADTRLEASEAT